MWPTFWAVLVMEGNFVLAAFDDFGLSVAADHSHTKTRLLQAQWKVILFLLVLLESQKG